MKLLNLSTSYFAFLLFVLITLWAVIFYYQMLDEIYDSLDDGLENQKILVIQQTSGNNELLEKSSFDEGYYTIKKVQYDQYKNYTESYRDTLMYMQNEEDFEPVRLLESVFEMDGSYYKIKVITSMVEEDDLIEDLLISLLFLYAGLIISILVLNNLVLKRIWNPFYVLLSQLKNFKIQDNKKPNFQPSRVEEFNLLNSRIDKFISKAQESYKSQKEFIENASHEMQTPLAIALNNLEQLLETEGLNQEQMELIGRTMTKLESLTRYNKSLLLLSKIQNDQFPEQEKIGINTILRNLIQDFDDIASSKNVQISFVEQSSAEIQMNPELAQILFTNLLKNAIIHSPDGGVVEVEVTSTSVSLSNSGETPLDENSIFTRFYKSGSSISSNGIGLAIAKAIAESYNLQLQYEFSDRHIFHISFLKK